MNFKLSLKYYFLSLGFGLAVFALLGFFILGNISNSPAKPASETYIPKPISGGCLFIEVEDMGAVALFLDSNNLTIYTSFLGRATLNALNSGRRITANTNNFCDFVDKCNGAIYTKSDNATYTVMGADLLTYIKAEDEQAAAEIAASLLKKMLRSGSISLLEENLTRLMDNSQGDFSYIHWAQQIAALQKIGESGSIYPLPSDDFIKLIKE